MDFEFIRRLVRDNYGIEATHISKRKNVYKVSVGIREYCLKVINYEFEHFYFIISGIKHLEKNGFDGIVKILKTKSNKDYIKIEDKFAYLTTWIDVKEADYLKDTDIINTAKKLKELHIKSKGFLVDEKMKPRIYWGSWLKNFETRIDEILEFGKKAIDKNIRTNFDRTFLKVLNEEVQRGKAAIENLKDSNYKIYMQKEVMGLGFCHHDLAHHNILIDRQNHFSFIDFDYCILDTHLHDLASFCMRVMRNGKWNLKTYDLITNAYGGTTEEEDLIIAAFLRFPQDYWQVGLQYYWEKLEWEESRFLGRLNNYILDRPMRKNFLDSLEARSKL